MALYIYNFLSFGYKEQALKFSEDPRSGLLTHTHTHTHTHTNKHTHTQTQTQTQREREREKLTSRT